MHLSGMYYKYTIIPFRVIKFRVEIHNALLRKYLPRINAHFFMRIGITVVFAGCLILAAAGCTNIGPGTIARDRFDYVDAISDSWKRQTLLNTVKMRYADAPVFVDVSSIVNQYSLVTRVDGSLSWNAILPGNSQMLAGSSIYADRPTITYQPLRGDKFTRSLMTPIPPAVIVSLIQSRWQVDMVLRICAQSVNGIYNRMGGRLTAHAMS